MDSWSFHLCCIEVEKNAVTMGSKLFYSPIWISQKNFKNLNIWQIESPDRNVFTLFSTMYITKSQSNFTNLVHFDESNKSLPAKLKNTRLKILSVYKAAHFWQLPDNSLTTAWQLNCSIRLSWVINGWCHGNRSVVYGPE